MLSPTDGVGDAAAEEAVDPRVQVELEKLNSATDEINKLEVDLDEARAAFRHLLMESTRRIDELAKKLGSCVERARPYYEARLRAKEALQEAQAAAVRFERANSAHSAAKEMVFLAEEGLKAEGRTFDHAWQEMLNHATMRVNESESERTLSEAEHRRTSQRYQEAEQRVQYLQKELKRTIAKSRPYFETKAQTNLVLETQKTRVKALEKQVAQSKLCYSRALGNLEKISDEIHQIRRESQCNGERGSGVGAECSRPCTPAKSKQNNSSDVAPVPNSNISMVSSDPPVVPDRQKSVMDEPSSERRVRDLLSQGMMMLNINAPHSPAHGTPGRRRSSSSRPCSKVPSPLEKSLFYLADDDSASDNESLASVEMLSDEQVASLMYDDLDEDPLLGLPVSQSVPASSRPPSSLSRTT
ncbi:SH3 domain-binding protein 5-like [Neocloeon triangulifer]|uniref:SH3 domain-binding protein 5-like n=1 Tax=Neocloeon triangulifer TaxID=2078957 RepID=UPI00286F4197|nr:SH3 domain-binding protein 5-like [Neocloeon triangulifer]